MNKKILSTLLVASMAITGLFAYTAPSVVLNATAIETDYNFKLQKLNADMTNFEDFDEGQIENIVLDAEGGITNAFTISTTAKGNMSKDISFTAEVITGAFKDSEDAAFDTNWYPVIIELSESATSENSDRGNEVVEYKSGTSGEYRAASTATFKTTFSRGIHPYGTEIARFKLQYKADDNLVAGTYTSTSKVNITTK